jgi:hypothetical protein
MCIECTCYRLVCHSKGTTQSYAEAIRAGHFKTKVQRMETYDRYGCSDLL